MAKETDATSGTVLTFAAVIAAITLLLVAFLAPWPEFFPVTDDPQKAIMLDLSAQQSMSVAAWVMAALTAVSIVIGSVTLLLLWRTLLATARSAQAAEAAAEAAREQVASSQELGEAQVRAYLAVTSLAMNLAPPFVEVTLANSGLSPARIVSVEVTASVEKATPGSAEWEQADESFARRFIADLPSNSPVSVVLRFSKRALIDEDDFLHVSETHRVRIVASGAIKYSDVFGHRMSERFAFQRTIYRTHHFDRKVVMERIPQASS